MTSRNGFAHCDICEKKLGTERYDLYKRFRGNLKIKRHYCLSCFESKIVPIQNKAMRKKYDLLCKGLRNGNKINVGKSSLNVFEAVMLKKDIETKYGFKEKE